VLRKPSQMKRAQKLEYHQTKNMGHMEDAKQTGGEYQLQQTHTPNMYATGKKKKEKEKNPNLTNKKKRHNL